MISVIVPVYKVEPYLRQCLDSILAQTYGDLEILLIDDGSPDRCGEICDEYARRDNRIRAFHTENQGNGAARNLGLQEAKGEYIGFVDSDDWLEPDMYEVLMQTLKGNDADISTCTYWTNFADNQVIRSIEKNVVCSGADAVKGLFSGKVSTFIWDKIYKKECWNDVRFPEGGQTYEDVAAIYKAILKAHFVSCISKPLYHYRMRANSIVHTYSMKNILNRWNTYYERNLFLSKLPDINRDQIFLKEMDCFLASLGVELYQKFCDLPKKERDYEFLRKVSSFQKDHFPPFGEKDWGCVFWIKFFFSRQTSDLSITLFRILKKGYWGFRKKEKQELFSGQ